MLLNDTLGTDPVSLGAEAIGDLLNGTDNAKQSLKGMKKAWNGSLTKQTFTDPKGAAKRVGKDLEKAGRDVARSAKKVGQKVDQGVKKAGKKIGDAGKKAGKSVGNFFKKTFKKKKKKRK